MADTVRALSALQTLLADNTGGAISPQDLRDAVISAVGRLYGRALAVDATLTADDIVIVATGGASGITLTLPGAANSPYKVYLVIKADAGAGAVTLDGEGSETINGAATYALSAQWKAALVWCDGAAWYVLGTGD
ncbi:MAG: hypothetical protein Kow00120_00250 [Anaerolineae bacterium]